jgi:ankyrin repeat protein
MEKAMLNRIWLLCALATLPVLGQLGNILDPPPLHISARDGKTELLRSQLDRSLRNINERVGVEQLAPLHYAAMGDYLEITRLLCANGAVVDVFDHTGWTPLWYAARENSVAVARELIERGADPTRRDMRRSWTAMHWVPSVEMAEILRNAGAEVLARDRDYVTPLHLTRSAELASYFLRHGVPLDAKTIDDERALHTAANADVAKVLVKAGADLGARDKSGATALHDAAARNNLELVRYLVTAGAKVDVVDGMGRTPLHMANANPDIGRLLIAHDAKVNARDRIGRTALHDADPRVALYLITEGADVNMADNMGQTPLHRAARFDRVPVIGVLLTNGALVNVPDRTRSTPLDLAFDHNNSKAAREIRTFGGKESVRKEGIFEY